MDTPDILIHVHPELPVEKRGALEDAVMGRAGVISAHFDHRKHSHVLLVVYNSEVTNGDEILAAVRKFDPVATMIGL